MKLEPIFAPTDPITAQALEEAHNLILPKDYGFYDLGDDEDEDEFLRYMTESKKGYKLPFPSLENDFLIAKNELTLVSGYTGLGKTELVNQILLDCVHQGAKGAIISLELTPFELRKRLYEQATGSSTITKNKFGLFRSHYLSKIKLWDGKKMSKADELIRIMENFYLQLNHTVFVLDNMMMLGARPDDYNKQYETIDAIKNFCKSYPVSVFLVAHPRKPKENYFINLHSKEEYSFDVPNIYDVSGSATIVNLVDNYLALGQNTIKMHVLKEIKAGRLDRRSCETFLKYGDVMLKRNKRREHGTLFNKELFFDVNFRRFKESEFDKLKPYVEV